MNDDEWTIDLTPEESARVQLFDAAWIARAFDVPPWTVGIGEPTGPTTGWRKVRIRAAQRIGRSGWQLGEWITDVADWLASKVAP